jgi:hypothetical protein
MFEQEITALANAIRGAVTKHKAENSVPMTRHVRIRKRDFTLMYQEDFAFANFPAERTEEDIWDLDDQMHFVDSVLVNLQEHKALVSALETDPKHAFPTDRFVRYVAFASSKGLTDARLQEIVKAFGHELDGLPISVGLTAFIAGLSIVESPLVISDSLTLRRPVPEDVAQYVTLDESGGFSFPKSETWFRVVGQLIFNVANTGVAQKKLLRTIGALRLFRVGAVAANRYSMEAQDSFLGPGVAVFGNPGLPGQRFYTLSTSDAASLKVFLHDIAPLTPDPFQPAAPAATEKEIAYMRYNEALFQDPPERAITSAVTALEALFLTNEPELRHRLAQRVSVFLRALGSHTDAPKTYDTVSKGYGIRSTFIHGGSLRPKDRPQADQLAPVLLEYARASVLAFLQIVTSKARLLTQLDRAMIDPAAVTELDGSLTPVVHK